MISISNALVSLMGYLEVLRDAGICILKDAGHMMGFLGIDVIKCIVCLVISCALQMCVLMAGLVNVHVLMELAKTIFYQRIIAAFLSLEQ